MKTLLVRLSSMGDLIHTLPAITDLAQHRPDVQLDWLCERAFADIARLHPFVQNVHEMAWRQWRKKLFQAATWQASVGWVLAPTRLNMTNNVPIFQAA